MLDPDVRRVLDGASLAHLAIIRPDGSPHAPPVSVGVHGGRVVFFTGPATHKARDLRRDPRVALSIAPAGNPFEPVVIRWAGRRGRHSVARPAVGCTVDC